MSAVKVGLVRVDQVSLHPYSVHDDLGDLRGLARSVRQFGLLQPIVVEEHAGQFRLRVGRRRLAAARLAGLTRVPAVIHATALSERDWLVQSIQENQQRTLLVLADRRRAAERMRQLGCSWAEVGTAFGVAPRTVAGWLCDVESGRSRTPRALATRRLVETYRDEFDQLLAEELDTRAEAEGENDAPTSMQTRADRRDRIVAEVSRWRAEGEAEDFTSIASRLGYRSPTSLTRALRRWGYAGLADSPGRSGRRAA